jgi:hypothetical protein
MIEIHEQCNRKFKNNCSFNSSAALSSFMYFCMAKVKTNQEFLNYGIKKI